MEVKMSFHTFIPDIKELTTLLSISHASSGKSVLIERNNTVWSNLSALTTINQWSPRNKIIQTSYIEIVGQGDGGKLGCFITSSLIFELAKLQKESFPKVLEDIKSCLPLLKEEIARLSTPSGEEDLVSISEGLPFGRSLAEACILSGGESHISLEKYEGVGCEVLQTESLRAELPTPYISDQVSLKGCMVALFSERIYKFDQIKECLELMGTFPNRPLLIVAPMIQGEALATLKRNRDEGVLECYAVETPHVTWGRGWLDDFASFTGATVIQSFLHKEFEVQHYGSAKEITIRPKEMIVEPYDDHAEITAERIDLLLKEASESPHTHTQDLWRKRASELAGSLIRVKIGGTTEAEARWNRNKAEKIMISMGDMLQNGHVIGAIPTLNNIRTGNKILDHALSAPLRVVARNKEVLVDKALEIDEVYSPFPVGRLVKLVERSISVATTLCSVGAIIHSRK
jgi:hypothetical protein